jgi:hypothetical protein
LDTVADVYFNDKHILFGKDMRTAHGIDVIELLHGEKEASAVELKILDAPNYARQGQARIGYKIPISTSVGVSTSF